MLSLADRADDDGFCWPSCHDIAKRTKVEYETVLRKLENLVFMGELYVHKRLGRNHQFLVLPGLITGELYENLSRRFDLSSEEITSWILFRDIDPTKVVGYTPDKLSGVLKKHLPLTISWGGTGLNVRGTPDKLIGTPLTFTPIEPSVNPKKKKPQETSITVWHPTYLKLLEVFEIEKKQWSYVSAKLDAVGAYSENSTLVVKIKNPQKMAWLNDRAKSSIDRLLPGIDPEFDEIKFVGVS